MDKKDRNSKPGDSEIVTKKGFLIIPPKRNKDKSATPAESNIKPAVTINQKPAPEKKQTDHDQKNNEKNRRKDFKRFGKKPHQNNQKQEEAAVQQKENTQRPQKNKPEKPNSEQNRDKQRNDRQQNRRDRDRNRKNPQNRENKNKEQNSKQNKKNGPGKIDPSVLGDLGFVHSNFSKISKAEEISSSEPTETIDYSKAIPLRDQIYPPKKEKAPITEEEKQGKTEIIGIRFKEAGKIYYFDPNGEEVSFGTPVIVETARGLEYGFTAIGNRFIPTDSIVSPLKKIIRIANREDTERLEANKRLEKQAEGVFIEKVAKLGLEMSLVGVEYTFDNTKILFYFAAENRIDFRELGT